MDARREMNSWRPTASVATLRRRAAALTATRDFFQARAVLEVETPIMVNAPVSDVNIGSVKTEVPGHAGAPLFLHTSPEYAMKRLLAAGSGDIFQVCHVFRGAERGRHHNPEFTMVEWYRLGFSLEQLMREVADLVRAVLGQDLPLEFVSYRDAVRATPASIRWTPDSRLQRAAQALGLDARHARAAGRDELLDLIVGAQVGPALGAATLTFMHRYPARRPRWRASIAETARGAALRALPSRRRARQRLPRVVERGRAAHAFAADQQSRAARGLPVASLDPHLLAALDAGLPDCAGVALGFDRVLMLARTPPASKMYWLSRRSAHEHPRVAALRFQQSGRGLRRAGARPARAARGERDLVANAANTAR
jgi:lysyl-tRNA synthetase class 2